MRLYLQMAFCTSWDRAASHLLLRKTLAMRLMSKMPLRRGSLSATLLSQLRPNQQKKRPKRKFRVSVRRQSDPADGLGMEETIHPQGPYVREKRT